MKREMASQAAKIPKGIEITLGQNTAMAENRSSSKPPLNIIRASVGLRIRRLEIAALTALLIRTAPAAVLPELKVSNLARNR